MLPTVFDKTQARARKSIFCVKSYKNVALNHLELIKDLKILFGAENSGLKWGASLIPTIRSSYARQMKKVSKFRNLFCIVPMTTGKLPINDELVAVNPLNFVRAETDRNMNLIRLKILSKGSKVHISCIMIFIILFFMIFTIPVMF